MINELFRYGAFNLSDAEVNIQPPPDAQGPHPQAPPAEFGPLIQKYNRYCRSSEPIREERPEKKSRVSHMDKYEAQV